MNRMVNVSFYDIKNFQFNGGYRHRPAKLDKMYRRIVTMHRILVSFKCYEGDNDKLR